MIRWLLDEIAIVYSVRGTASCRWDVVSGLASGEDNASVK